MASMLDLGQQTPPAGLGAAMEAAMEAAMTSGGVDHSGHLLAQAVREAAALNYC
jgi:hypothetical protein